MEGCAAAPETDDYSVIILRKKNLFLFLIALVPVILYWQGIFGDFVWDDRTYFIDNDILPNLKPWQLSEILFHPSNYWGNLNPLRDFLYVLEYNLFGLSPLGYHIVSLGLYVLVCCMVYLFLRSFYLNVAKNRLLRSARNDKCGTWSGAISSDVSAFFVTLIFATHPVHVETVAYISGQRELLYSLFSLLSIYAFFLFFNSQRKNLLALGILSYYFALLSKPTAVILAIFIPLLYLLSDSSKRPGFKKTLKVWGIVNLPVILWILKSIQLRENYFGINAVILDLPFWGRIIRALKILGTHTALVLKPYPLNFGYPFESSVSFDINLLSGIIAIIVIVSLILYFRKDHLIVLGSCLFILFLLPVLQLHGSLANLSIYDRYLFIPALGIAILMERFLRFLPLALNRIKIVYLSIILGLVLVFAAITIAYVPTFKSDIASTRNSYEKFPDWPSSSFNYVYSLIEGGRLDEAWDITIREKSFSSPPWVRSYFKGWIYLQRGELEKAVSTLSYSSTFAISEGYFPFPNIPLGRALMASGRYNEAEQEFEKVLSSKIYQPLEMYHARKELEKLRRKSRRQY